MHKYGLSNRDWLYFADKPVQCGEGGYLEGLPVGDPGGKAFWGGFALGARNPRGDEEKKGERIEQGDGLSEYVGFDVQLWD